MGGWVHFLSLGSKYSNWIYRWFTWPSVCSQCDITSIADGHTDTPGVWKLADTLGVWKLADTPRVWKLADTPRVRKLADTPGVRKLADTLGVWKLRS